MEAGRALAGGTAFRTGGRTFAFCGLLTVAAFDDAEAQNFLGNTELTGFRVGSSLSDTARDALRIRYELSDGTPVDMSRWYGSHWTDLGFTFVTRIDPYFGIYWGFSTGERGEKYKIEPGLKLGFIRLFEVSQREVVSISGTAVLGGRLKERTCTADYGEIGGVQRVNCRLAATPLPPAETLRHLWDDPAADRLEISVRYTLTF